MGGQLASEGEIPWQAVINPKPDNDCGAVILNHEWLISAKHCLPTPANNCGQNFGVGIISLLGVPDNNKFSCDYFVEHPSEDVVLYHLNEPLCFSENVQPIKLFDNSYDDALLISGMDVLISGWGNLDDDNGGNLDPNLRKALMPLLSDEEMASYPNGDCTANITYDPASEISVHEDGKSGAPTDSGGPAVVYINNEPILIGILKKTASPYSKCPTTSTRIKPISDWIYQHISQLEYSCYDVCYIPETTQEIIENQSITFSDVHNISTHISIRAGGELIVKGTLHMDEDRYIKVEEGGRLSVDGGIITKSSCNLAGLWEGIIIDGINSTAAGSGIGGVVDIQNGGIVEFAKIGVNKLNKKSDLGIGGLPSQISTNVGQLIMTNTATIRNCEIGIQLNSTGGSNFAGLSLESSTIDNSTFENNDIAILLKSNRGLAVDYSTFNANYIGIEITNSYVDITNNDFINQQAGIFINAPYPTLMGSNIQGNSFTGTPVPGSPNLQDFLGSFSVYNESLNNAEYLNIQGNTMIGYDIYNLGLSTFNVANNDLLHGYHAITSSATGLYLNNVVQDNSFFNNDIGNNVDGMNDIEYLTNCFEATTRADIGLGVATTIDGEQGRFEFSAGNCFDHGSRIQTTDIDNPATAFKYFTKDGNSNAASNCKGPGSGNFTVELSDNESDNSLCGSGSPIFGDLPAQYRDCEAFLANHVGNLEDFIQALEDEIDYLTQQVVNGQLNNWVAQRLIDQYKECIDSAIKEIVVKILVESDGTDRDGAITFLTTRPEFRYQIMAYGLLLDKRDYSQARTLLNNLIPTRTDETDFLAVQHIYLDYLEAPGSYVLNQNDRNMIYDVGEKRLPLSGFARTAYYHLTGDRHFINVPAFDGSIHNRVIKAEKENVVIYPTPAHSDDIIHITINESSNKESSYNCEIFNTMGKLLSSHTLMAGDNTLDLNAGDKGILFVRIMYEDKIIHTGRIIRI